MLPILAIRAAFSNLPIAIGLGVAALLPIALAREFAAVLPSDGDGFTVDTAHPYDEGFASYALGFLLPAVMVPLDDPGAIAAMVAFFLFFGWIWVHGYLGHQNPVLALMGWHCWQATVRRNGVTTAVPEDVIMLTNLERVGMGTTVWVAAYDGRVWYARKRRGESASG